MVKGIDHIGIVVRNMEDSLKKYQSLLGLKLKEIEEVKVEGAVNRVAFLPLGSINLELITTTAASGIVADFLKERGEGIHHIAFEVENLEKLFQEMRSQGVQFLWDKIINGSRGSRIAFFKPEEMNGVYVELVQRH